MDTTYFNHHIYPVDGWWEKRRFIANWWRLYASDPYWVPPHYPTLRTSLEPTQNPHLARLNPLAVYLEALPRKGTSSGYPNVPSAAFEVPVAAAIALYDSRRKDNTAYLSCLYCINYRENLERLLDYFAEKLRPKGIRKIVGPMGLSPHLGSGLLQDYWNRLPPLHTPYNPPYTPELATASMRVRSKSQLYEIKIPEERLVAPSIKAELIPLDSAELMGSLQSLFAATCPRWLDIPPPDNEEIAFLIRWLQPWPLFGWLAQVDHQPVGFVLLQPDLSPRLRRANGGRNPFWRLWLTWSKRRAVNHGRLLFGGVLPQWRGQGIGRQLLHQAMLTAQQNGWQSLTIGPLPVTAPAVKFLSQNGATAQQSYLIYQREL